MVILNLLQWIGRFVASVVTGIGEVVVFLLAALVAACSPPIRWRLYGRQLLEIGWYSLPVIGTTCLFAGMVITLQSHIGFARFNAESAISSIVALSMTRELSPVLCGLLVAGRCGSAIAAEISTMKLNHQIDALNSMLISPLHFLVAPRLVVMVLCLPLLVLLGDIIGIMGGYGIAVGVLHLDGATYLFSTWSTLSVADVSAGLIKAAVFGLLIALMGCVQGLKSSRDARGVGIATTSAVIYGSMLILIFNFIITAVLF